MSTILAELFKGFWGWITGLLWWQGLIAVSVILIIVLIGKFWRNIVSWFGDLIAENTDTLQYRMFTGLTTTIIFVVLKDLVRVSFKENGFEELSGPDFANYVKDKSQMLINKIRQQIMTLYPPNKRKVKVKMEDILKFMDEKEREFEDIIFEIYVEAKRCKRQAILQHDKIDKQFTSDVDKFIKKKSSELECKDCLMMLFAKREIAENKRRKIKTLKNQMNFAELKLAQIQMIMLDFYSAKLNNK